MPEPPEHKAEPGHETLGSLRARRTAMRVASVIAFPAMKGFRPQRIRAMTAEEIDRYNAKRRSEIPTYLLRLRPEQDFQYEPATPFPLMLPFIYLLVGSGAALAVFWLAFG